MQFVLKLQNIFLFRSSSVFESICLFWYVCFLDGIYFVNGEAVSYTACDYDVIITNDEDVDDISLCRYIIGDMTIYPEPLSDLFDFQVCQKS